jgi:ankyrin repeat protein
MVARRSQHRAAEQGCTEIVGLLLEHGLPVDVRDLKGRTALMHAAMDNNLAMAQVRICACAVRAVVRVRWCVCHVCGEDEHLPTGPAAVGSGS